MIEEKAEKLRSAEKTKKLSCLVSSVSFNSSLCSTHLTKLEFNFSYTRSRKKTETFLRKHTKEIFSFKIESTSINISFKKHIDGYVRDGLALTYSALIICIYSLSDSVDTKKRDFLYMLCNF